jgi:hypothetical protein
MKINFEKIGLGRKIGCKASLFTRRELKEKPG